MKDSKKAPALVLDGKSAKVNLDKPPRARHTPMTDSVFDILLERLTQGESLIKICRESGMPNWNAIWRYMARNPQAQERYAVARAAQAHIIAQEALDEAIKGSGDPARDRLAFDARRWYASKVAPRSFGDRVDHKIDVSEGYIEALRLVNERLKMRQREVRSVIDSA
jgi:hypothetical protein